MDITKTLEPRSDQLNYDDVSVRPVTVTISDVRAGSAEQPVELHLAEFPGRPFKPSKSMRRVIVSAWGPEASVFVGRRMTLYGDPDVKFGGQAVGGIRISHLSDIDGPLKVALTVTRGKRAPFTVQPLSGTTKPSNAERVANAVKAIHATATPEELANIRSRIGADIASDPAISQALETQTRKLGTQ
jgi:hypothetical protein